MAASTREVYLLLRARDEASRIVRGFGSELLRSAAQAQAAALRAEAQTHRQTAATMRAAGATRQQVASHIVAAKALEQQARQLEVNEQNSRRFAQSLTAVSSALETLGIGLAIAGGLAINFFFQSAKLFAEYQRQVALTRTQIDGFTASMEEVGEVGLDVARRIPVAFEQIQPALFDIFSSTNASLAQSKVLLEGFAKAAVAGQTDIQTAARGTIAIMNGLNIPFEKVNDVLDIQFELVRKGVGTYEEFAKVFGRVIPAANRSQQSFETVAAMLAFMTRNGQSAALAATAAARALELFTHPGAVKNLEAFGVKVKDVQGNFLPLIEILRQLRTELLKLPQADRVAKIVELFKGSGFNIQARRFLEQVVLGTGELEDFAQLLEAMGSASGVMEDKYGEMADTMAAKTQLLSNKWMALRLAVGEAATPALIALVDIMGKIIDKFNELDPGTKRMITKFAMIAAAGAVVLGILIAFLGLIAGITAAFVVASAEILITIGVLAVLSTSFLALGVAIVTAWQQSKGFRDLLTDIKNDAVELATIISDFGSKVKQSFEYEVMPPLRALWKLVDEEVIPAFNRFRSEVWDKMRPQVEEALRIIQVIGTAVFAALGNIIETVVIPTVRGLTEWWEKNKKELMPLIEALAQVTLFMLLVVAALVGAGLIGALMTLAAAVTFVVNGFVVLVETYKVVRNVIFALIDAYKALWNWVHDLGKKVGEVVADAKKWLFGAGENMIAGLIDGMMKKFNAVKDTAKKIAQSIVDFFPHSPAKTGPLSGAGSPFRSGQMISDMLAAGMLDKMGILNSATNAVAAAASPFGTSSVDFIPGSSSGTGTGTGSPPGFGPPPGAGTTNNVTVNIKTNEVDPRQTGAELGFELAGRL